MSGNEDKDAEREFFHDQFASGLSYSAINTARSALSIVSYFLIVVHLEISPWLSDSCKVSLKQDHHCQDTETYGMFLLFWTTCKIYRHLSSLTLGT